MRGHVNPQAMLFSYVSPESRVSAAHPLRCIKVVADQVLRELSPTLAAMYSAVGRPSIPPERLLKSELLIALYSVRSRRLFCERLDYDLLFRWFLDMSLDEPGFEHSTFSQNSERLLAHAVAQRFFDAVVAYARREGLLSDEHFTVDGTLIEAWASLKSVTPKHPSAPAAPPDDPGNPTVNFHGDRRTNATHQSTTDPEARLARKGAGKEATLCFSGHVLMENRHGLCVDLQIAPATGTAERETALTMLRRQARRGIRPTTLGADKGYHCRDFVRRLRQRGIRPHLACVRSRRTPGLDGRTTRHASYRLSQRLRKKVEEIFGWMKTIGGLRKSRFHGVARTQHASYLVVAAYNLLRLSRLRPLLATG
ncbi:MAG: IS5 family transposase [Planctomycetaceae bacterium]|nr:IS5 family transposase [Planctomycetaceae bacterium]